MEVFKDIEGYEGRYAVSNLGNVYSTPKDGKRNRILKQEVCKKPHTNYRRVTLSKEGKVKRFMVHRLVAIHFIDNPGNKPEVNHIDSNGENNYMDNLEWNTGSENMKHSHAQGRQLDVSVLGQKASAIKRRETKINEIKDLCNQTFGYLKIVGHRVVQHTNCTRLQAVCKCMRCDETEVYRELIEITRSKKELQCRNCVAKYGKLNKG